MKWPAKRISQCSPKSFGMYEEAAKLMAQGQDVIHLEVGRPSFDTPQHIKDATIKSLQEAAGDIPGAIAEVERSAARSNLAIAATCLSSLRPV